MDDSRGDQLPRSPIAPKRSLSASAGPLLVRSETTLALSEIAASPGRAHHEAMPQKPWSWFFAFKVWWSMTWRATVLNAVVGGAIWTLDVIFGGDVDDVSIWAGTWVAIVAGGLIGLWITLWALRQALMIHVKTAR